MPAKHVKSRREDRDYEDLVRLYLEDVGRHDLLTKDDEVRLAQAIEVAAPSISRMAPDSDAVSTSIGTIRDQSNCRYTSSPTMIV